MSTVYDSGGAVGFLIPWSTLSKATWSESLSTLSSHTPIPARPTADQASEGRVVALGDWETPPGGGTGYKARVQTGGNVGPQMATFAWKDSAEADTSYRGHDWPTRARRMWVGLARTNETAGRADMVTLPSGRVVIVQPVLNGGQIEIRGGYLDDETLVGGTAGDEIMIVTEDAAHAKYEGWDLIAATAGATVEWWDEEELVLAAVRYQTGDASKSCNGQVALFQSADEGATWSLRTPTALVQPFVGGSSRSLASGEPGALILRRCGGSWSLLSAYYNTTPNPDEHTIEQWAGTSPDHMVLVERGILEAGGAADGVKEIAACSDGTGITVIGCGYDDGGAVYVDVHCWRMGSAWQPLSETPRTNLYSSPYAGRHPAIAIDPDGTMWAVVLSDDLRYTRLLYSLDRGESWLSAGYNPIETAANGDIQYTQIIPYRGGLLLTFASVNTGGSGAGDFEAGARLLGYIVALGGWDNGPLPYVALAGNQGRLGYGQAATTGTFFVADCLSWFPPVTLTATAPAGALTGAVPTYTYPDGGEPYASFADAGAGSYVDFVPAAVDYDSTGIIVEVDCSLSVVGTSAAADNKAMQVRLPDAPGGGANIIEVSVQLGSASVVLYDERAGAAISTIGIAGGTRRKYRLAILSKGGVIRVSLLYRTPDSQVWTQVTGTTTSGASVAGARVRCGATTTNGQTLRFYSIQFVGTVGPSGPRDPTRALAVANIHGRPCSSDGVHIHQGLRVAWRRGPLHPAETWSIGQTAKFPPAAVGARDYPSPSTRWRSSADNALQEWVWEPAGGQLWRPPGAVFGMLLYGDGVETVTLAGRDSTGAYVTLITASPSSGFTGLSYTAPATAAPVSGGSLRPNTTGTTASRPWRENELAGGWVRIATSGLSYRITGNSPGLWGPSASLKPTIYLADWDGTEPATGTVAVYPPVSLHVAPEQNPTTGYDRIRLRIAASANTVDGRYELKAIIGSVFCSGRRNSYGRVPSVEPIARGVETAGGRVYHDPNQPLRRVGKLAWADPYGTRDLHGYTTTAGPDALLLASGGTQAVSFVSATHRELQGVLELNGGPGRTLVYLPRVEASLTAWSTSDPDRFLLGRITSALVTPRPYGDEGVREEVTISELTISGEI